MSLKPEKIKDLSPDKLSSILERSAVDVSGVYDYVRRIVEDVRIRGDAALLEANRELKRDLSSADLQVSPEELEEAYGKVDSKVVDALEKAARNILKFRSKEA
jgi:histidinol dehydrogenase